MLNVECCFVYCFGCLLGGLGGGLGLCFGDCLHVALGCFGKCLEGLGSEGFLVGVLWGLACLE